ncbi:hypothetical protein PAPYR_10138 [Paratrimastix pyriformis]|uniref:Uncharacterized protein n=1 Tax=Paratrimastix pyriformis TaxID=342808 RepID=A0ABQ8UDU2_9EUKA|nr:hypothetical protein PAPYR_10138 [Paratrimastix pyriformis]
MKAGSIQFSINGIQQQGINVPPPRSFLDMRTQVQTFFPDDFIAGFTFTAGEKEYVLWDDLTLGSYLRQNPHPPIAINFVRDEYIADPRRSSEDAAARHLLVPVFSMAHSMGFRCTTVEAAGQPPVPLLLPPGRPLPENALPRLLAMAAQVLGFQVMALSYCDQNPAEQSAAPICLYHRTALSLSYVLNRSIFIGTEAVLDTEAALTRYLALDPLPPLRALLAVRSKPFQPAPTPEGHRARRRRRRPRVVGAEDAVTKQEGAAPGGDEAVGAAAAAPAPHGQGLRSAKDVSLTEPRASFVSVVSPTHPPDFEPSGLIDSLRHLVLHPEVDAAAGHPLPLLLLALVQQLQTAATVALLRDPQAFEILVRLLASPRLLSSNPFAMALLLQILYAVPPTAALRARFAEAGGPEGVAWMLAHPRTAAPESPLPALLLPLLVEYMVPRHVPAFVRAGGAAALVRLLPALGAESLEQFLFVVGDFYTIIEARVAMEQGLAHRLAPQLEACQQPNLTSLLLNLLLLLAPAHDTDGFRELAAVVVRLLANHELTVMLTSAITGLLQRDIFRRAFAAEAALGPAVVRLLSPTASSALQGCALSLVRGCLPDPPCRAALRRAGCLSALVGLAPDPRDQRLVCWYLVTLKELADEPEDREALVALGVTRVLTALLAESTRPISDVVCALQAILEPPSASPGVVEDAAEPGDRSGPAEAQASEGRAARRKKKKLELDPLRAPASQLRAAARDWMKSPPKKEECLNDPAPSLDSGSQWEGRIAQPVGLLGPHGAPSAPPLLLCAPEAASDCCGPGQAAPSGQLELNIDNAPSPLSLTCPQLRMSRLEGPRRAGSTWPAPCWSGSRGTRAAILKLAVRAPNLRD